MSCHPGMGVMIGMLGGNAETVAAIKASLNKVIQSAVLENNELRLSFADGTRLSLSDDGQSCCELRYMATDDDLAAHIGATLLDLETAEAPGVYDEYGEHEVQFLRAKTDRGVIVCSNHNEHNGYYGGFWIIARLDMADGSPLAKSEPPKGTEGGVDR